MTLIIIIAIAAIAFLIGKYSERLQWNKLIKTGKIPKPNNPDLNHSDYWASRY